MEEGRNRRGAARDAPREGVGGSGSRPLSRGRRSRRLSAKESHRRIRLLRVCTLHACRALGSWPADGRPRDRLAVRHSLPAPRRACTDAGNVAAYETVDVKSNTPEFAARHGVRRGRRDGEPARRRGRRAISLISVPRARTSRRWRPAHAILAGTSIRGGSSSPEDRSGSSTGDRRRSWLQRPRVLRVRDPQLSSSVSACLAASRRQTRRLASNRRLRHSKRFSGPRASRGGSPGAAGPPRAAAATERDDRPRLAEEPRHQRQRDDAEDRGQRGVARDAKTASQSTAQISPATGATPRNVPPAVATVFPPFSKRSQSGRQWPSMAAPPARTPARSSRARRRARRGRAPCRRRRR